MRILLVEGDAAAAKTLTRVLQNAGFTVDGAETGEEALEMVRHYDYDIAVLELDLPDMEGSELLRRLRHFRHPVPAIALSSSALPAVRLRAFAAGADDVVSRPFDQCELVARIQAIMRRSRGYAAPVLQIGNLRLNLDSHEVSVDDRPVHLTGKEYSILELLVLRKGMVLTKDAFLNHLYGGMDEPEMKIIDVFICKLRKKLQLVGAGHLISTVWGRGYMLREDDRLSAGSGETTMPGSQAIESALARSAA